MKKVSFIFAVVVVMVFVFSSGALAECVGCATIKITSKTVPNETYRSVTISYSFPAGFPSWAEEKFGVVYSDPLLVLADKIEDIEVERIRENSYLRKIPANFYTKDGCLIITKTFRAYRGEFIQLLATTWDGKKYELAMDDPAKRPGINQIYCITGAFFTKMSDGSWGVKIR
jgi:hypothetical protein